MARIWAGGPGQQRPVLVVMLKEPRAGRVKTRLGRDIGMTEAAWWFRHQTRALLRRVSDPRWHLVLAIAPDRAVRTSAFSPALPRVPQGGGDLGHRMGRLFRSAPPGPVAIIGGDIPGVTASQIARAFTALRAHDAVIGPADDGGYWLIGLKRLRVPATLFRDVRWSTADALANTRVSLGDLRIATVDTLIDIDTAADLQRFCHDAARGP